MSTRSGLSRTRGPQARELAHGAVGSARVTAYGLRVCPVRARWPRADQRVRLATAGRGTLHVRIRGWVLFVVILAAVAGVAYLGIGTSSWVDLVLVAGEVAVIAGLAITILVKIGPVHYSAAVLEPTSSPSGQFTDITNAMIYGITAFVGFETAAALGEEARNARRSIPASTIGIVIVTGLPLPDVTRAPQAPALSSRLASTGPAPAGNSMDAPLLS
jgi:amino acid transporter